VFRTVNYSLIGEGVIKFVMVHLYAVHATLFGGVK